MLVHYLLLYSVIIVVCKCVWLNVSRGAQNGNDMFTNLDTTATCPRTSDKGAPWCQSRNGLCSNHGCCVCVCNWSFSTFQVDLKPTASRCVGNSAIRTFAGCDHYRFTSVGPVNPLLTFDLSRSGFKGIDIPDLTSKAKCKLKDVKYLIQKNWNVVPKEEAKSFLVDNSKSWPYVKLEWTGQLPSTYFGHVLKVNAECKHGKDKRTFCVVFKAKGSLTYDVQIPTRQPATTVTVSSTTTSTSTAASKIETTMAATRRTASVPRTQRSTSRTGTTPSSTKVALKRTTARTAIVPTTENDSGASGESSTTGAQTGLITEEISTITKQTNSGKKAPKKDSNIEGGKISDTMLIITVSVAVAICVAVIALSVWLICQRRRRKDAANLDPRTTVLQNPTVRSQDHLPMPGLLRNPVYAEPQKGVNTTDLVDNGTLTAGSNLLLENPGATSGRSSSGRENTYNNMERKRARGGGPELDEEKLLYQGLVGQEAQRFPAASNVSLYQSLKPDGVLYEPLRKNVNVDESPDEGPKYLRLLNPGEIRPHSSPSPPTYQPPYSMGPPPMDIDEPPEYADYADLDELEERATNGAHDTTPGQGPCHPAPTYDVLEGPYSESCHSPSYEVLEGPDSTPATIRGSGQEASMYRVLEGPAVENGNDYLELLSVY